MVQISALWCIVEGTSRSTTAIRQSVSLPSGVARRVQALAKRRRTSANRVIVELIENGLQAREREKKEFFDLADRLVNSADVLEQKQLKEELARMTFGQ
jgi:predicted transcriptional regulator